MASARTGARHVHALHTSKATQEHPEIRAVTLTLRLIHMIVKVQVKNGEAVRRDQKLTVTRRSLHARPHRKTRADHHLVSIHANTGFMPLRILLARLQRNKRTQLHTRTGSVHSTTSGISRNIGGETRGINRRAHAHGRVVYEQLRHSLSSLTFSLSKTATPFARANSTTAPRDTIISQGAMRAKTSPC